MRLSAPAAFSTPDPAPAFPPWPPPSTFQRPCRFGVCSLCPIARTPAPGVHPSKLFPLTWSCPLSRPRREPCREHPFRFVRGLCPRNVAGGSTPTNKFAEHRFQPGFWALLPLRIRQSHATECRTRPAASLGFCLSKDFPLPAPDPSSRAFRSRTSAVGRATVNSFVPQRFSLRGGQLSLARLSISLESMRSGRCPF
jgi:hypothetical protein